MQQTEPPPMPDEGADALERAAAAYLRKRGYEVVVPEWAAVANSKDGAPAARLRRAAASFEMLADWAEAGASVVRAELLEALVPTFAHVFLELVAQGEPDKAAALLAAHAGAYLPGRHGARTMAVLDSLRAVRSPGDLAHTEIYLHFQKEERVVVTVSPLARDLLLSRLLAGDMADLAGIFQRRTRLAEPGEAALPDPVTEGMDAEVRAINAASVAFAVDVAAPPMAYGASSGDTAACASEQQRALYSAANVADTCGLPLPRPDSRARVRASAHFRDWAARRDEIGASRLPSVVAYLVESGDDDPYGEVNAMALSSNARFCAAATARGTRLWDLDTSEPDAAARRAGGLAAAPLQPAGAVFGHLDGQEGEPELAPAAAGSSAPPRPYHCSHLGGWVRTLALAFSSAAELLLTAGQDGAVRLWDVPRRGSMAVFARHAAPVWAVDWCPTDHYFVSGGMDGEGLLWSVERSTPLRVLFPLAAHQRGRTMAPGPEVEVVRTHPSNRFAALAVDETVVIWDVASPTPARVFGGTSAVCALAFSADGSQLAVGDADGGIALWDVAAAKVWRRLPAAHKGPVHALDFSWPSRATPGDSLLFSGGADGAARLWQAAPGDAPPDDAGAADLSRPRRVGGPLLADFKTGAGGGCVTPLIGGCFTLANLLLVAGAGGGASVPG